MGRAKVAPFGLIISTGTFPSLPPVQPPPAVHVCATESYDAARCTASLESAASALCRPTIYAPVAGEQKPPSGEASRPIASPNLPLALEDPSTDTGQAKPTGCISSCTRTCKYYYFHRYVHVHCPCHAISYFSWPPRAQKCNYSCICIPASPASFPPNWAICHFSLHCLRLKRSQSSPPSARFSLYVSHCVRSSPSVNSGDPQARFPSLSCRYYPACRAFFFSRIHSCFLFSPQFLFLYVATSLLFYRLFLPLSHILFSLPFATLLIRTHRACLTEAEIKHYELDPSSKIGHDTYLIAPGVSHIDSEPGFPHPSHLIRSTPSHL